MTAGDAGSAGNGVTDETTAGIEEPTAAPAADAAGAPGEAPVEEAAEPTADERIAELTADLQRERAQFANFRRRAAEDQLNASTRGREIVVEKLLPILDDLDRAREHGDLEEGPLRAFADKITAILEGEGLARFGVAGEVFDPEIHEAIQNDGSGDEPVLGEVYRVGYRLGDKVIRQAMVTVTDPAAQA